MIRRPPRSTLSSSSAASDVYKRQVSTQSTGDEASSMVKIIVQPAIVLAAGMGDIEGVQTQIDQDPTSVQAVNSEDGMTALIIAAEQGNLDLISCLLSGKADPNAADHAEDRALHYLAQSECVGGIELLVGAGADLEATNEDKQTPLHVAASNGMTENIAHLLEANADITAKDLGGYTALHMAELSRHDEAAELLRSTGGNASMDPFKKTGKFSYYPPGSKIPEKAKSVHGRDCDRKDLFGRDIQKKPEAKLSDFF
eukprot:TRINITY_DN5635_c0_g1_i4.p1 TRINITY_DN5635_c0_g1~~TRINITY_DN5635_c0_g1_i4.p1  ORF type:complete len:256 (+),score=70.79 TRINITY_DN5635_c0_g1_i4:121-888(+)